MPRSGLKLTGVTKRFGATDVVCNVDLEVQPGELVVIVGPSGCGKSTLLRLIAGLETPTTGTIRIGERDVTAVEPAKRGIAMVFQSYALYPHMSVAENMGFGLRIRRMPRAEVHTRVARAAETLQLEQLLERKPRELSGGQRQRVAIGRAIVRNPEVFLFDEPLSNLDAALRGQMRVEIARLHAQLGATMVYVTHDQVEAMTLASRIVVLNGGRVEQVGAPLDLYREPANLFVAGFLGAPRMNFLPGRVASRSADMATLEIAGVPLRAARAAQSDLRAGSAVIFGVRPEDTRLVASGTATGHPADTNGPFRGTVSLVERLGSESLVHLQLDGAGQVPMVARISGDVAVDRGSHTRWSADFSRSHLFDSAGRRVNAEIEVAHPASLASLSAGA